MTEAEFFDDVYEQASGDEASVPWQHAISRDFINSWLDDYEPTKGTRAMVVAAGLGDDAASLARKDAQVTAFDFSPTAVAWAKSRHTNLNIAWHEADLFSLPNTWDEAFDLVVEVFTIQSIPPPRQNAAAQAIRQLITSGGTLVAVMLINQTTRQLPGPPWPLDPSTVALLTSDLDEVSRRHQELDDTTSITLIELAKPLSS